MSRYLVSTRSAYYAVVASLPLLIAYEILLSVGGDLPGGQIRNAADVWLRSLLGAVGLTASQVSLGMILVLFLSIPVIRSGSVRLELRYFGGMLVESFAYAVVLGIVINFVLGFLFSALASGSGGGFAAGYPVALGAGTSLVQRIALSLGAGLFEELVFRVILVGLLLAVTRLVFKEWLSVLVSITGAAFLFSLAHYVGPLGEQLLLNSFLFRWMAGLLFSALFYLRGFAITAYSHALYDIWVLTGAP
ncbi:MAG: CPBP family intramembrane metalloprotease [SAR324 cluster bacterium]|nr:CPBP family intramembrane metalloprotease [SAR324 cluster bacterium]